MLEVNALLSTSCPAEKGMNKKFFFKTHKMAEMDLKNEKYKKKEEKKQIQKYFFSFFVSEIHVESQKSKLSEKWIWKIPEKEEEKSIVFHSFHINMSYSWDFPFFFETSLPLGWFWGAFLRMKWDFCEFKAKLLKKTLFQVF